MNPAIVRSYDLRGVVGRDLTEADAHLLGLKLANAVRARGGRTVAVGYDGRLSSPMLEAALVDGLAAGGVAVERTGLGPTGQLYYAVHARGLDGGVMVTGSHNPSDQNGFKILIGVEPVFGQALRELVEGPADPASGGSAREVAVVDAYRDRLLNAAEGAPALRIGWDAGSGATGEMLRRLTGRLSGEHRMIHCDVDGRFPGHHPDPSVPENLRDLIALVRDEQLDLGIAFDGDGDRIGVVDGDGEIVWPDQLLLFLAEDVLARRPGASVVADVKSSRVLFDGIDAAGGRGVLSPSGYVLIREAMLREGAPLAGEMSGHLFFADDWYGTDDALHNALRLLAAIGRRGSLTEWRRKLPRTYATPELRLACPDADKARVLAEVERDLAAEGATINRTDGLRVTAPDGWWLLRASGTEPKLTARVEAWTPDALERLRGDLSARLAAAGLAAECIGGG
ncbi:phosphomannomutase [Sphingomonas lenta]|uniref:Phosphomannomutase n=1 Tax=Sphingomonas lenta TaxID=1141887 RepID=A0A2A2SGQ5_9SPHN|nr:phosphomannomutase [Sphingomonas lenta]